MAFVFFIFFCFWVVWIYIFSFVKSSNKKSCWVWSAAWERKSLCFPEVIFLLVKALFWPFYGRCFYFCGLMFSWFPAFFVFAPHSAFNFSFDGINWGGWYRNGACHHKNGDDEGKNCGFHNIDFFVSFLFDMSSIYIFYNKSRQNKRFLYYVYFYWLCMQ